jgi:2-oxoisovalerate dehydrogenase E1 component
MKKTEIYVNTFIVHQEVTKLFNCNSLPTKKRLGFSYYRDESILLGIGFEPYQLMLQLLAKADDPFSGGRSYYSHPSSRDENKPKSFTKALLQECRRFRRRSCTGIKYIQDFNLQQFENNPVVVCSLGDNSVTEGEVSEAYNLQLYTSFQLFSLFRIMNGEFL